MAPNTACDNTMYQNFGTSVAPDSGFKYSWAAVNADVYAIGSNGQYALINFNNPGVATIYLYVGNEATGCLSDQGYNVTVSTTENSSPEVIYVNGAKDGINIYPNPTAENINVDIQAVAGGNFRIEVLNLLGQSVNSITTKDHNVKIDVANLPAGCYLVDCYNDGVKIATAKFIKN